VIKLAIIGSGDLGQLIAHHARLTQQFEVVGYFDDYAQAGEIKSGIPVLGSTQLVEASFQSGVFEQLMIAIGYKHFDARAFFFDKYFGSIPFATVVHPSAIVDPTCEIGEGSAVLSGCILDVHVKIGKNVLLNTGVMVAHDSSIGDHSFLAPRCNIAGFVQVGTKNFIGIGANVIDNISTVALAFVGGGALVNRNIEEPGLFVGVPAKKIK
jgi:sugar O-acyltransferase (sialic acid O-acetyltransferase NeuD family)